ncbi:MAG: hypothetical protein LBK94_05010 [Prevotellaceae bacterium]|jgi:hypothetical protein|nr:hypothetical protein [Prevotellaceae bacterium]
MKGKKAIWEPVDLMIIVENFDKMTLSRLHEHVNNFRSDADSVDLSALRHQLRRMGLKKQMQIRWSAEDIAFLKNRYRKIGNVELARRLNSRKKTFRKIDGKKVFRVFTKKHVEKKLKLLGLARSPKELSAIRKQNRKGVFRAKITFGQREYVNG